jgi:hypothetical protein
MYAVLGSIARQLELIQGDDTLEFEVKDALIAGCRLPWLAI